MPPRYQSQLTNQQPVRSNAPQMFASLSQKLTAFSEKEENELDRVMQKKAKEKGLIDAQGKTEITLRDGNTIADEAWNAGASASHLAAVKNDMTENLTRIYTENKNNPEAIKELSGAYGKGMIEGVPEELQPLVQDQLANSILKNTLAGESNMRTNQRNEQIANTNTALDGLKSEYLDALDSGDVELATDLELQAKTMIDAMAIADPELADDAVKLKADLDKAGNRQMVIGEFKNAMESGKDDEFIKKFQDKKLSKTFDPNAREKIVTEMLSMQRRRDNVLGVKKENFAKDMKQTLKAYAAGFPVSTQDMALTRSKAREVDKLEEFDKAIDDIDVVNQYSKADVGTRRAEIERLGGTGSVEDYNKWSALKKSDAFLKDAAEKDGYTLGVQQQVIEPVEIDLQDPATFAARKEQAQVLSKHYGVEVSAFTDQETTQFTEGLPQMTPKEQVMAATALAQLDDPKLFRNIAKKGAPVFSMGAAMNDPIASEIVFTGQQELRLGNAQKMSKTDYLEPLTSRLSGVYGGENLQAVHQSVLAYVAAKNPSGEYDEDIMDEAITAVTGGIGSVNGSPVELPRGVDGSDLEDFVDAFTADTVRAIGGVDGRTDEDAARMIRDSMWQNKRDTNGYVVRGKFGTLYQNGEPLVINYDPTLQGLAPKPKRQYAPYGVDKFDNPLPKPEGARK